MTIPNVTEITATAPDRSQPPAVFNTNAAAFLAAVKVLSGELAVSIPSMNTDIAQANADAASAANSAAEAATSATNAASSEAAATVVAGASMWVSGQAYDPPDAAVSIIDAQTYRAKVSTSGTTDPSLSPDWAQISSKPNPTFQAVASGALANGDAVIVNADGTVSVVSSTPTSFGTPAVFESAANAYTSAVYDSTNDKVVIAYRDGGSSFFGTAVVGTVSGTSISFGTPTVFESAASNDISATYHSTAGKVVIAYSDAGNSNFGTAIVGTVSGTSISFGTPTVFESANSNHISATYDSTNGKVVIAYKDTGNSNFGTAIVGTVSGTSISFGTPAVFNSAFSEYNSATYHSTAGKVIIAYSNGGFGIGTAVVGTVSGTSISFVPPVVFNNADSNHISAVYDSTNEKVVIAYSDAGNSNFGTAIVGTVGTSIGFGTPTVFNSANSNQISATYDSANDKVIIAYADGGNSNFGTSIVGAVAGASIGFGTPAVFESAASSWTSATYDSTNDKVVIAYRDGGSGFGTAVVLQPELSSLTAENFIGFSDNDYADGTTAAIQIVGSVNEAQSGLIPGKRYYVQSTGGIGPEATTPPVVAGTAVAATKIIVKG